MTNSKRGDGDGALALWLARQDDVSGSSLGRALGVSRSTVSLWKSRRRVPQPHNLLRLSDVTGIKLRHLLEGKGGK